MSDESLDYLEPYRGKTVLVLGATGFVGRWVCRHLTRCGAHLVMAGRDRASMERVGQAYTLQGRVVIVDVTDGAAVSALVDEYRPVVTFNLAGYGVDRGEREPDLMRSINAQAPVALAQYLAGRNSADAWSGLSLVQVGSAFEYGVLQGLITEETKPQPNNAYGETKLAATEGIAELVESGGLQAATVRLATVYGPGEHPHRLLPSLLGAARTGEPVKLTSGVQERDFTYVDDVAVGLLRVGTVSAVPGAVVNLCTGRLTAVKDFVSTAAEVLDLKEDQIRLGALEQMSDEVWQGPLSTERLEGMLGWKPATGIEAGVRATRTFLAANGTDA